MIIQLILLDAECVVTVHRLRSPRHPMSTSARSASFRPEIVIARHTIRVLAEQTAAVDPEWLGEHAGHLTKDELQRLDAALRIILGL